VTGPGVAEVRAMLAAVAREVIAHEHVLGQADRAIGDGDHGTGMRRGFTAAADRLQADGSATVEDVFRAVGTTLTATMGGASGVVFGLMFSAGPPAGAGHPELTATVLVEHLGRALEEITRRGRARPGDKTMIDALDPAVHALRTAAQAGATLADALRGAQSAAEEGAERTRGYVARFGKARALHERALGHPDPGALSVALILRAMADWAATALPLQTP
jgi:phosphoenolpyruvate---glycerone phosphotransferase subunit DhaL